MITKIELFSQRVKPTDKSDKPPVERVVGMVTSDPENLNTKFCVACILAQGWRDITCSSVKPEVAPVATPEITHEAVPAVTSEVTPEVVPVVTPEVTSNTFPRVIAYDDLTKSLTAKDVTNTIIPKGTRCRMIFSPKK